MSPSISDFKTNIYRHYKGNEYRILAVAKHCDTLEEMVVYQDEHAPEKIWVRPKAVFDEMVEVNGEMVSRFEKRRRPMTITICCSLSFWEKALQLKDELEQRGHRVLIPHSMERFAAGDLSIEEIDTQKNGGSYHEFVATNNLIRCHHKKIVDADVILVVNEAKKGIDNYIGVNTFLEIGFAHVLHKPIYILNDLPEESPFLEEIKSMEHTLLKGDLSLIKTI